MDDKRIIEVYKEACERFISDDLKSEANAWILDQLDDDLSRDMRKKEFGLDRK
jgi:hypothetical protein